MRTFEKQKIVYRYFAFDNGACPRFFSAICGMESEQRGRGDGTGFVTHCRVRWHRTRCT